MTQILISSCNFLILDWLLDTQLCFSVVKYCVMVDSNLSVAVAFLPIVL